MRQHGDEWIRDCADDPLSHFRLAEVESGMHRRHDKIEFSQDLIIEIERAIAQNVALNSTENVNVAERALQFSNLRALDVESRRVQPVGLY